MYKIIKSEEYTEDLSDEGIEKKPQVDDDEYELLYTPTAILDLLSQIDELSEYDLGLSKGLDDTLMLQIGDSHYELETRNEVEVILEEDKLQEIEDLNEEAYDEIVDLDEVGTPIEGGLIKEALKTLLIGGIVRAGKAYLKS